MSLNKCFLPAKAEKQMLFTGSGGKRVTYKKHSKTKKVILSCHFRQKALKVKNFSIANFLSQRILSSISRRFQNVV